MLFNNLLLISTYFRLLNKYQITKNIAYKYYIIIILYSKSYRVFKIKKFNFAILIKNYYNII